MASHADVSVVVRLRMPYVVALAVTLVGLLAAGATVGVLHVRHRHQARRLAAGEVMLASLQLPDQLQRQRDDVCSSSPSSLCASTPELAGPVVGEVAALLHIPAPADAPCTAAAPRLDVPSCALHGRIDGFPVTALIYQHFDLAATIKAHEPVVVGTQLDLVLDLPGGDDD